MTIHRGLSELKLIDSKIEKQISEIEATAVMQKGKKISGYMTEDEFQKAAESKFNSINALIARKNSIKSAIVEANGRTMVTISGATMTIADAINFKESIKFKKHLISKLKNSHQTAVSNLHRRNEVVGTNLQKILEATFGKDNTKVSQDDVEAVCKPYIDANEWHLFDPLKVDKTVEALEKEVADFESEVDAILSEINAVTLIEV